MNKIKKVTIDGFWGDKKVTLNFQEDINFLIGVNGSGKTTIINLIAATLNADFSTLDRIQFERIHILLNDKNPDTKKSSYIEVLKSTQKSSPFPNINFNIQLSNKEKPETFLLNELEEEQLIRYPNEFIVRQIRRRHGKLESDVYSRLKELVNVTWLSIHRTTSFRKHEERSLESTIDQKIDELSTALVKYISLLSRKYTEETNVFQQYIFLSLLTDESEEEFFSLVKGLEADKEKESLRQIFNLFKLNENIYSKKLNKHFDSYKIAIEKMKNKEPSLRLNDFAYLLGTRRIHSVVQEWNKLLENKNLIYNPLNTFLSTINTLLQRKEVFINEKNELAVRTQSGKILSLFNLSSGEKQLIIILGESLLQESAPHIYIADEPELSLHVDWQEKLVSSLKGLNPNSQIIFATHSPDIVSSYSNSVIKIEEAIK